MITVNNAVKFSDRKHPNDMELKGLSTDTKPTEIDGNAIAVNSIFLELDTKDFYYFDGEEWQKVEIEDPSGEYDRDIAEINRKLKKRVYYFDNVANMKVATDLEDGEYVVTKGYYSSNDGGGAKYLIRTKANADVEDNGSIHFIGNTLVAELIAENGQVNVKQFGARGDGDAQNPHDDTNAFVNAIKKYRNIVIPKATYNVDYVNFKEGCIVEGNNSVINAAISATALCAIGSYSTINNLTINSTNPDRKNNRIDLSEKHHITINNCKFTGFRQSTLGGDTNYNVWALYFKNTKNVSLKNCIFGNNSFEDIIIEYGCENLYFENLTSEDNGVRIDIEPSSDVSTSNITFENCVIDFIHTTDYYYTGNTTKNITCSNCIIDTLAYHGADLIMTNCVINTIRSLVIDNRIFGGNLKLINSCSFSENLIKDPYFDTVALNNTNSYWNVSYASTSFKTLLGTVIDEDGIFTVLNPDNLLKNIYITTPKIDVTPNEKLLLRTFSKSKYPATGTTSQSLHIVIRYIGTYYNPRTEQEEETVMSSTTASINRSPIGSITPLCEQATLIRIPEIGQFTIPPREDIEEEPLVVDLIPTYMTVSYRNGGEGSQALYLRECGLYRIKPTTIGLTRNLPEINNREKRIFNSNIIPTSYYNKYNVGDIMYFNNPTDYIGAVCTDSTNWGGTWKKFGSLETEL